MIDGNTFVIRYDGELTSVRIRNMDAPERNEPGGPAATQRLSNCLKAAGNVVELTFPANSQGKEQRREGFGRLLADVKVWLTWQGRWRAMDLATALKRHG